MDTHHAAPDSDGRERAPQASALVASCETAWAAIQQRHPEVPDVVIVLGTGVERGRLVKLGHWWGGRWIADGEIRGEVLLAGEALHLAPEDVFEVLLHEAAHGLNAARGVQDSSRGGRYHNARFKATAEELGLEVQQGRPYGWARTSVGPIARDRYDAEIIQLGDAMRIARRVAADVHVGGTDERADSDGRGARQSRDDRQPAVTCGCGRRMRMAPSVLAQGPVFCGVCGQEFSTPRTIDDRASPRRDADIAHDPLGASVGQFDSPLGEQLVQSDLNTTQREGLSELVELGTRGEGALLLTEVGAWYAARGAGTQRPLLGTTSEEVEAANRAARAMLKLDGTLHGPSVSAAGHELVVGDLVTIRDSLEDLIDVDGNELPPFAVFGTIEHIEAHSGDIVIDFATAGRHTVGIDSLAAAALEYGYADYAATTHAATVDSSAVHHLAAPERDVVELAP
jgi:hypothetical protein